MARLGRDARYVIIGNGVAGTTAAEQLRKGDPNARVDLIGAEPYPLYNRVALPPFLKGDVREEKVLIRTVDAHRDKGINLHLNTRITHVDLDERVAYTEDERAFPFDKLLIATGGRPNPLPVPGAQGIGHIHNFQTLDDTKAIIERIHTAKSAVVVGGSYIAYELAEGFRARGLETTWVIRGSRFLRRLLDEEGGALVDAIARDHGVQTIYNAEVRELHAKGGVVTAVTTTDGTHVDADLVGVGLGLTLNVEFLSGTGIDVKYGIVTDEYLRSSHPDVFAAGDVAEFYDRVVQSHHTMGTWNNSVSHGKTAAENMLGGTQAYETVPTYTSGLFNSKLAVMGTTPEISSEVTAVSSCDMHARTYKRLFFLGSRLVGAVLIGDVSDRRRLLQRIRAGEPVSNPHSLLTP